MFGKLKTKTKGFTGTVFKRGGFTLVEMMVAISIFSLVMVISMGAILSVLDANKKSQSMRSVMDNLNYTLESMTRTVRFSTNYHCGSGDITQPLDCAYPSGSNSLSVLDSTGNQVTYGIRNGRITRQIGGDSAIDLTAPDVIIDSLYFYVSGSNPSPDAEQPWVMVSIKGHITGKSNVSSSFSLETTISQRKYDL